MNFTEHFGWMTERSRQQAVQCKELISDIVVDENKGRCVVCLEGILIEQSHNKSQDEEIPLANGTELGQN